MKKITQYVAAVEAIGMRGRRTTIHNKLNSVYAATDDPDLRSMLAILIDRFSSTSTNPDHTPIEGMSACKATARKVRAHCELQIDKLRQAGS